jgi:nucleoside-diphosphate-sugar epimerase
VHVSPRALVTGCAGFIGSHLARRLVSHGWDVVGVDAFTDFYARRLKESNLAALREEPRFRFVEADLLDAPLEALLEDRDTVFHLAGQPGVRQSFGAGALACVRNNVRATERLLASSARRHLRAFVYASSSSVYGVQGTSPVREDAPLRPISPYGQTKVLTERLAESAWRRRGVPVVGLRYFTVYGPGQRPDMAVARFVASALAGRPLTINGTGLQIREFTFVNDVVRATIGAAERGRAGAVYNVGGGERRTVLDVVACLGRLLDRRLEVVHTPPAQGDPPRTGADTTRAREELGFVPTTSVANGLSAQLARATRHAPALEAIAIR